MTDEVQTGETPRRKPGRPKNKPMPGRMTGETANRSIRLGENLEQRMNAWRVAQWRAKPEEGIPTESDAIRMLIDLGLKSENL